MDLSEFLKARLEAQNEKEWDERWLVGIPPERHEKARAVLRKTMAYQWSQAGVAIQAAGWAVVADLPYVNSAARQKAAEFADHPDYQEDWRP